MPKRKDLWKVLVCHRINEAEEDQEALRNIVEELEANQIWKKDKPVFKSGAYYRHKYSKQIKAVKRRILIIKALNKDV